MVRNYYGCPNYSTRNFYCIDFLYRIRLVVEDGQGGDHIDEAFVDLRVVEAVTVKEPVSPWLILLIILIIVGSIAALREWKARKRRRLEGLI